MALLDFLKKKEEASVAKAKADKEKAKKPAKAEKVSDKREAEKPEKKVEKKEKAVTAKTGFSYSAVKEPHISEKATYMGEENKYVFNVSNDCNKKEAQKAIAGIYGVDVLSVNIIKIPAKKRRMGRNQGWKPGYKKAIVTIKEGQKIEIL